MIEEQSHFENNMDIDEFARYIIMEKEVTIAPDNFLIWVDIANAGDVLKAIFKLQVHILGGEKTYSTWELAISADCTADCIGIQLDKLPTNELNGFNEELMAKLNYYICEKHQSSS